jgi:hypothetical protein
MKKPKPLLVILIVFFLPLFVIFIIAASLLGENGRVDAVINDFFLNIQKGDYFKAQEHIAETSHAGNFNNIDQFSDFSFLLELSLLKKFNLIDKKNYKVEIRKSHYWIPFLQEEKIYVNVLFKEIKEAKLLNLFQGRESQKSSITAKGNDYIDNLFVVRRIDGIWKITEIRILNPQISKIFQDLEKKFKSKKILSMDANTITFINFKIDVNESSPLEKRMAKYFLYKTLYLIDNGGKMDKSAP